MNVVERIHDGYTYGRRVRKLSHHLSETIPANATVLDVGCGDGLISSLITSKRPDVTIKGIDVLLRPHTHISVEQFDGRRIPYDDKSFDTVMFVDVLHHTIDPRELIGEAVRVARSSIVIKDHTREGILAGTTLRFMDYVGNARHDVVLPYNYWTRKQWREAFASFELDAEVWKQNLNLYGRFGDLFFGRSLHFVSCLRLTKRRIASQQASSWCNAGDLAKAV